MAGRTLTIYWASCLLFLAETHGRTARSPTTARIWCIHNSKGHSLLNKAISSAPRGRRSRVFQKVPGPSRLGRSSSLVRNRRALECFPRCCRSSSRFLAWGPCGRFRSCGGTLWQGRFSKRALWLATQLAKSFALECNRTGRHLACIQGLCSKIHCFQTSRWGRQCLGVDSSSAPLFLSFVGRFQFTSYLFYWQF